MTSTFKKIALAAALVAGSFASQAATVGQPVTIQDSAIAGAVANQVVVDQLSGQYDEVLTVTPINLSSGTFATSAIFNASGWFANGNPASSQLAGFNTANSYGMYIKFVGTGGYTVSGGALSFSGGTGAMEIWADANRDTDYNVANTTTGLYTDLVLASGAASLTDDVKLGSASSIFVAAGNAAGGVANGNFEIIFNDFTLTAPAGEAYFVAPRPFYMLLDLNGNFQSFNPNSATDVLLLNNSANGFFMKVPEPGALALAGLAFAAAGLASRRGRK